jgi:hypothetical protein
MKRIQLIDTETTFTPRFVRAKHFSPLHTPTSVQNPFNPSNPRSLENGTRMQEMRGVRTDYGLLRLSGITLIGFIYFYCSNTYFLCGDFMKRYKKNRLFRMRAKF